MAIHSSARSLDIGIAPFEEFSDAGFFANGNVCTEVQSRFHVQRTTVKRSSKKLVTFCKHATNGAGSYIYSGQGLGRLCVSHLSLGFDRSPKYENVQVPAAVATAVRVAFSEEEVQPWHLDTTLLELKRLRDSISKSKTLHQKLEILDAYPQVKATFTRPVLSGKPVVSYALQTLGDHDIYLLKCLVAGGQEHVLDVSATWLDHLGIHAGNNVCSNSKSVNMPDGILRPLKGSAKGGYSAEHQLCRELHTHSLKVDNMLKRLVKVLHEMELFYDSIGGIIGYQIAVLELMRVAEVKEHAASSGKNDSRNSSDVTSPRFFVPLGPDLNNDKDYATKAAVWGLEALPMMGEIYPLGGSGDRLGLVDEVTGEPLPVAMLPYCGRTLLEGLLRDLQAREYLHFKLFGQQHITPVAIMTSAAKQNHNLVTGLCEDRGWFGRGKSSFYIFAQPLIPTVAVEDGRWLISEPLVPVLKPGGHGVIWKLAHDKGVFDWFYSKGRHAAIVRQISNPIAATDVTLLALAGVGWQQKKKFGFASCERKVGAAEGVNVLIERKTQDGWEYCVTCVEYTEFNRLGIPDVPVSSGSMQAQYPANTNVLYVDLLSVEHVAAAQGPASLPGMILNLKKEIKFEDYLGAVCSAFAGRLECTMQNVADYLTNKYQYQLDTSEHDNLGTFVLYNQRRKVTSSAKRKRKPNDSSLHQTPDGSFLDVVWNAHNLLSSCMVDMPELESKECYVEQGPPFIVLLHPAIGPVWDIIRQKIIGGSLSKGSELQLEIAEIFWHDVELDGSLLVTAENVVGCLKEKNCGEQIIHYGEGCGRCRLENVKVRNRGIDWDSKENAYWQHKVRRFEAVHIILKGNSEFEADDVILEGSHTFEVPDGFKMTVTKECQGFTRALSPLPAAGRTWNWCYTLETSGKIAVKFEEN